MEDKLIKTNHGPLHYCIKKFSTNFAIFLIAIGVVAIPITIAASISFNDTQTELNPTTSEVVETQTEEIDLLTY